MPKPSWWVEGECEDEGEDEGENEGEDEGEGGKRNAVSMRVSKGGMRQAGCCMSGNLDLRPPRRCARKRTSACYPTTS